MRGLSRLATLARWILGGLLAAIVAAAASLPVFSLWHGRSNAAEVDYLRANAAGLDMSHSDAGFTLGPDNPSARVFLLGEAHGVAVGQSLDLALLRHLNATRGVRFYVGEFEPGQPHFLNRYLDSGDEGHLDRVFSFWLGQRAQWGNDEFRGKIIAIRTLNGTLPEDRQIRFIGMDRLQDAALTAELLRDMTSDLSASNAPWINRVQQALAEPSVAEDATATGPLALMGRDLATMLANEFASSPVDPGVREVILMLADHAGLENRNAKTLAAFQRLLADQKMAGETFYALWGMAHAIKAPVNDSPMLAQRLSEQFGSKAVVSAIIINLNSRMMLPSGALPWVTSNGLYSETPYSMDDPWLSTLSGIESFKDAATGNITLFDLRASPSPFAVASKRGWSLSGLLGFLQPFRIGLVEPKSAPIDYVILARGSSATTPGRLDTTTTARPQ